MELYGAVGPSAGVYRIILDSLVVETFNASRSRFSPHTLLYVASGLSPGRHTVGISNTPNDYYDTTTLSIDYVVVWGPP